MENNDIKWSGNLFERFAKEYDGDPDDYAQSMVNDLKLVQGSLIFRTQDNGVGILLIKGKTKAGKEIMLSQEGQFIFNDMDKEPKMKYPYIFYDGVDISRMVLACLDEVSEDNYGDVSRTDKWCHLVK